MSPQLSKICNFTLFLYLDNSNYILRDLLWLATVRRKQIIVGRIKTAALRLSCSSCQTFIDLNKQMNAQSVRSSTNPFQLLTECYTAFTLLRAVHILEIMHFYSNTRQKKPSKSHYANELIIIMLFI